MVLIFAQLAKRIFRRRPMIKIYYGNDRVRAKKAIQQFLGLNYEVIDGANLEPSTLPTIFLGASLFAEKRSILLRDFSENKSVYEKLPDYLETPHNIAILESKLDKRSATFKALKGKVELCEFTLPEKTNFNQVFDIYKTAKNDGPKAVAILAKIKSSEDPIQFAGLLNSQAIRDFALRQGSKEKRALKGLSKLDLELKSSKLQPWLLIESFLLQVSSWQ